MFTCEWFNGFRNPLSGLFLILAGFLGATPVTGQMPMFPPPPPSPIPNPLPNCPELPIATANGIWYYVTSDCHGISGFGQSLTFYNNSQCLNGVCLNPVSIIVGTPASPDKAIAGVMDMEQIVEALSERLNRITSRPSGDRTNRATKLKPITAQTLAYLRSSASDEQKRAAFDQLMAALEEHEARWSFVGLASPNTTRRWIRDVQTPDAPKTAAETDLDISSADTTKIIVSVVRDELLRIEMENETVPEAYFQSFTLTVRRVGAGQPTRSMQYGIECAPTDAEKAASVSAVLSERGKYSHRLRDSAGRPVLVNGYTNLE